METNTLLSRLPLAFFLLLHFSCCFYNAIGSTPPVSAAQQNGRLALEIVIGGGSTPPGYPPENGDCPPPPPPPCPPPPPPPRPPKMVPPHPPPRPPSPTPPLYVNPEIERSARIIQRFGRNILNDPKGVVKTWTGNKLCIDKSKYVGFICYKGDSEPNSKFRLVGVDFNGNNFNTKPGRGPLLVQGFLENLKDTVFFHANSNNFTGAIPYNISKLRQFYELDLSNNKLVGAFPKPVLSATLLTFLDLRFNFLTGPIPPQVFKLDLDVLFLNNNGFTGNIPENLGQTPVLFLTLANNKLTGPIPKSIGQTAINLLEVLLLNNQLSGCLPYEIGFLNKTTIFDASINKLTGPIPNSFGCLEEMQIMNFTFNQLYGAVPESLCALDDLMSVDLRFNYFTQVGEECRELIKKGILDMSMNCILDLPNQRSAKECAAFFSVGRTCPDPSSLNYVPCKIHHRSNRQQQTSHRVRKKARSPSRAYEALKGKHD
ncbi:OLC1v1010202C1 [Oldenlandia corymbosa var. corymbosa]|uniref:OLC1v1010202C1 n=1 Tax=Oldenlandia corymbosa var. corymbosa TaxID=529605 RepID=A0AAV1DT58_OLDCO|nr:OLC1v1010202C1 [Oldenlandia corymbosa var. corymbosa]